MLAHLVERGALHRKNAPIRVGGRMGAAEHVEGRLRIAVVGQRAAVGGQQHFVAGMRDGRLFEHGGGLRTLTVGAEGLSISQRRVDILGIGAISLAIRFDRALRILGGGRRF
jgi:hypothetical protein